MNFLQVDNEVTDWNEQTAMCRFIGAFAITFAKLRVPHKNYSFEAV